MSKRTEATWLAGILAVALAARVILVTVVDPGPPLKGGDGPFYLTVAQNLANGYGLSSGQLATYKTDPIITIGPLYPIYLSVFYVAFGGYVTHPIIDPPVPFKGGDAWIRSARLGQAVIGTLTVAAVYALAKQVAASAEPEKPGWRARAGLVAAGIMALDPRFIVETSAVYTETLLTFFIIAALSIYLAAHLRSDARLYALAWLILGLAAMTRPSALALYPVLLLHMWIARPHAQALEQSIILAGMLALILTPWLVRNYLALGKLTMFGDAAASHFWLGAIRNGEWQGLDDFMRQQLAIAGGDPNNPPYLQVALTVIAQHPLGFVQLLGLKLARAYLQPMGTVFFSGPSLKELTLDTVAGRMSLAALVSHAAFWPKLIIYITHFGTIVLGVIGMWHIRRAWRDTLPLILAVVVTSVTYALLTIIPRYLFPIMPVFVVFAAGTIVRLWPWHGPARAASTLRVRVPLPGQEPAHGGTAGDDPLRVQGG
ncbi:MAG: glycosyltransferase family 39 protein [Chloroflexi bacterium]|nr:glycosyltransferase family 39 protein [Chloroflexota bacterium]